MKHVLVFMVLAVSLALASHTVSAAELEYYGIEAEIGRNLHTSITVTMTPVEPINHIDYTLDFRVYNFSAVLRSGVSKCELENVGSGSVISCDLFGMEPGKTMIRFHFNTRESVRQIEGNYEFRANFPVILSAESSFSLVKLPERALLSEEIVNQSYFPPSGSILTDGKRMMVSWSGDNLVADETLRYSVLFEIMGGSDPLWDLIVISLTFIVVIIMVSVGLYMRRGSSPKEGEVKVLPLLNKDEKKIVDIVAREGGELRQNMIVKESDYSKAKVSRLIKNLKERGVVYTEPISGRENKVILKIKGVG